MAPIIIEFGDLNRDIEYFWYSLFAGVFFGCVFAAMLISRSKRPVTTVNKDGRSLRFILVSGFVVTGVLLGATWGYQANLRGFYFIAVEANKIALRFAKPNRVITINLSDIGEIRPGLTSRRSDRAYTIVIYTKQGERYESAIIDKRSLSTQLEELRSLAKQTP